MKNGRLSEKVAIVTGASKGIGAGIALAMGREGAAVVVNYSSSEAAAKKVVAEIIAAGGKAVGIQGDVSKAADVARLFAETKKAFGTPNVLVNNAGVFRPGPFAETTEDTFHWHFNTNVLGPVLTSLEAGRSAREDRAQSPGPPPRRRGRGRPGTTRLIGRPVLSSQLPP